MPDTIDLDGWLDQSRWNTAVAASLADQEKKRREGCPVRLRLDEIARKELGLELDSEYGKTVKIETATTDPTSQQISEQHKAA